MDELLSRKMGCSFYFIAVLVSAAEDQRQMSKTTLCCCRHPAPPELTGRFPSAAIRAGFS